MYKCRNQLQCLDPAGSASIDGEAYTSCKEHRSQGLTDSLPKRLLDQGHKLTDDMAPRLLHSQTLSLYRPHQHVSLQGHRLRHGRCPLQLGSTNHNPRSPSQPSTPSSKRTYGPTMTAASSAQTPATVSWAPSSTYPPRSWPRRSSRQRALCAPTMR